MKLAWLVMVGPELTAKTILLFTDSAMEMALRIQRPESLSNRTSGSLMPPAPATEFQNVTSSTFSAPSAVPEALLKVLIRPLIWTTIWVGPTSPMLSGGM